MYKQPKKDFEETEHSFFLDVPDVSLMLITQGKLAIEYREGKNSWEGLQTNAGQWCVAPGSKEPYELRCRTISNEPIESLMIHINKDFIKNTATPLIHDTFTHVDIQKRMAFHDPLLTQLGLALQQELQAPDIAGKLYIESITHTLVAHLLRHYAQIETIPKKITYGLSSRQIKKAIDYIEQNLDQDLSVTEIAQESGLSPFHFARLFRQMTDESPHQYIINRRIEGAQRLLKETDLPISQIALMTGFASQSHLTRAFTKRQGEPPHQYRHRH